MTSLLRELVPVPMASSASSTRVSRPRSASARAIARPTTPAPMTTQSIFSAIFNASPWRDAGRLYGGAGASRACLFEGYLLGDRVAIEPRIPARLTCRGWAAASACRRAVSFQLDHDGVPRAVREALFAVDGAFGGEGHGACLVAARAAGAVQRECPYRSARKGDDH